MTIYIYIYVCAMQYTYAYTNAYVHEQNKGPEPIVNQIQ